VLLISVVTPVLNQRAFISQTIDSIIGQDYPYLEYLVVDGGSTDGTLEIVQRYKDRLRWISEADDGQSAAINKGWRMTDGDIVAWLNADDTYLPGAVRKVAEFMAVHADVDVVYGDCDYIDSRGQFMRPYPVRPHDYREMVRTTLNYIPQPATFIRRRVLKAEGLLDENLHYVMDFDYWLRVGRRCTFAYLPVRLATLRLHQSAKSVAMAGKFAEELVYVYRRLFGLSDLPEDVRTIEREAMSNIYYRAAHCAFWAGRFGEARRYARRAWRYRPLRPRRMLAQTLLGGAGLWIAERLRGNPFLDEFTPRK
jgi:glycosyltransferase involved in cell wall biosynthesis